MLIEPGAVPVRLRARGLVLCTLLFAGLAAQGAEPLWELGLGLGALDLPHYRGANQSHSAVFPVPYVVYRGEIFKSDRDGARAELLRTDQLKVDLSLAASPPTRSADNLARAGMASLPPTFEIGPKLELNLARGARWQLDLRLPVHGVVTVQRSPRWLGVTSSPFINLDVPWQGWKFGALTGPVFNSRGVNAHTYEVSAADATAQRPAWAARGGYAGWRGLVAVSRQDGRLWWGAFARVDNLSHTAMQDSPLLRSRHNVSAGLGMTWVFAQSSQSAP